VKSPNVENTVIGWSVCGVIAREMRMILNWRTET